MLDHAFLDWWYAPWVYDCDRPSCVALARSELALRDAYRLFCLERKIIADLPPQFDARWQFAATSDGKELVAAARLFAGLLAAREQNHTALASLPLADRKWCFRVASTQPLRALAPVAGMMELAAGSMEIFGLTELVLRLETGFRGVWDRLRLTLPISLSQRFDSLLSEMDVGVVGSAEMTEKSAIRSQRCWRICLARANLTLGILDGERELQ